MHLKSIEIAGFKSFAEKTVLTFLPPRDNRYSVTAIVGPNGSGKSNIVDALRWVMGEQSMKNLRGKKSADIIFAGSAGKGRMSVASVAITLDNADHRMPVDYDDVVIQRRILQSGESVYAVGGNPVRLFDIQILLAQAQFGHGSYGIIGQGMIDRLLSQSAAERKEFFDEACGIKEFQIKRHQAALKLDRTRAHVAEAELLMNEIAPRLKTLSRQVKKLEERQGIEMTLREAQASYYASLWNSGAAALQALRAAHAAFTQKMETHQELLLTLQDELDQFAREGSREEQFKALQRRYQEMLEEKQSCVREEMSLAVKLETEYASRGNLDVGWMTKKLETMEEELNRARTERDRAAIDQANAAAVLEREERELGAVAHKRKEAADRLKGLEEELQRLKNETPAMAGSEYRAVDAVMAGRETHGTVYGTVADLGRAKIESHALALDVAAGHHVSSVVTEDDRVAERWIRELRASRIGVATFLPRSTVKPRALPHDSASLLRQPGVIGLAADLTEYDQKFASIFSFVLGGTLVVESVAVARAIGVGRVRMVTLDGDLVETSGSMKGGYRHKKLSGFSFSKERLGSRLAVAVAEKDRMAAALQDELRALDAASSACDDRRQRAYRDFEGVQSRAGHAEERERMLARERGALADEYAVLTADPKQYGEIICGFRDRREKLQDEIAAFDRSIRGAATAMDRFHAGEEEKKKRMFEIQGRMQEIQQSQNALSEEKNAKRVDIARLETKQEDIALESENELRESPAAIIARGAPILAMDAAQGAFQDIQKLKYQLTLIGGIDEEVMIEYKDTRLRHDGLFGQLEDLKKAMADLAALIAELDDMMAKRRSEKFRDIKKGFARYFAMFFDGGKADLVEVYGNEQSADGYEPTDPEMEAESRKPKAESSALVGIDVIANPPGKKITNIQALSGGERTMTSLALLSAILYANPSPFVVLDEVEAALDEANTVRFGNILRELAVASQFILITHNRATMHAADTLYGVTMGGDGISRLLSVALEGKEA